MNILNRRYQLLEADGEDYCGITYLALDLTDSKRKVRVKVLNQEPQVADMVKYFSENFLYLSATEHENLLESLRFDLITTIDNKAIEDKKYFFVTGYYESSELLSYLHLNQEERMFVLMEVCYALQFLHFRGIVYRYLTFDNLLIRRDKDGKLSVKLRDLASQVGFFEQLRVDVDKSLQTLAPEILLREQGTIASDIYAVGVVAYYLLNGIDIHQHAFERTRLYSPNVALQKMIENATAIHADERIQNIYSLIQSLGDQFAMPYTFKDRKFYERLNFNVRILGRDRELQQAKQLVTYRLNNMSGYAGLFIQGDSGLGKTRLLKELHYTLRIQGVRGIVLEIDKDRQGFHEQFGALLLDLVKQFPVPPSLIDRFGSELVKVVPLLREMWHVQPSEPLTGEREVLKLNNRIVSFILELSQLMPIALYLDNIDALNDNEFSILENLMALNDNMPLFVITTYTELDLNRMNAIAQLQQSGQYQEMQLENFGIEETAEHLQQVLFMDKRPLQLATRIISEGSGNPRYIEEVLRNLFVRNYIYIHETRKWFISDEGYHHVNTPLSLDEAVMGSLKGFDKTSQRILQALAVFGKPIHKEMFIQLANVEIESFEPRVQQLLELKILQVKLSDWGYTFDFYNRNLARMLYDTITVRRKSHFHLKSAVLLEKNFIEEGTQGEALVKHLVAAKKYLKAIEYAIKLGDRMTSLALYGQALDYYLQALRLFEHIEAHELRANLLKAIADIHFQTGENQKAFTQYQALVNLASDYKMLEVKIDAQLKIGEILINRKQLEQIEPLFLEIRTQLEHIPHIFGQLELALLEFRYFISVRNLQKAKALTLEALTLAETIQNSYYIGRFLNNMGILYSYLGEEATGEIKPYEQAYAYFLKAANYLEQTPNCSDLSRAYNNLGVIALNNLVDIEKARGYFDKALRILAKHNVVEGKSIYLLNLGETYVLEGQIHRALRYYHEAEQVSEDTQNIENLILVTMNLLEAYIEIKNYKEAYKYLQRFERDFEPLADMAWDLDIKRFYYLSGVFYLRMREVMLAKAYFDRVSQEHSFLLDSSGRYRYHLIRFVFDHIITEQRLVGSVNFEGLDALESMAGNELEKRYYLDLLLDLALDLIAMDTPIHLPRLIKKILSMSLEETTESQRIKMAMIMASQEQAPHVERFEEIINLYMHQMNIENRVLLCMMVGKAYLDIGDLYKALQYYLDALDIVHEQTMSLPVGLRAGYVLSDALRMQIFTRIQNIKQEMSVAKPHLSDKLKVYKAIAEPNSLEAYFDLGDMESVFNHVAFKRSIQESYNKRFNLRIEHTEQLMQLFQRDQLYNLQLILRYLTQVALAQVGAIFAVNEYGVVEAVIKSEEQINVPDLEGLIKQYGDSPEGVLVEHKRRLYMERSLMPRKSLMFFPIYNGQHWEANPHRRRSDFLDENYHEVLGYLYLESDKLLNNINPTTFENVKQFNNLLYVMLDTFLLKKSATIDRLTGVYLRKYIETEFNKALAEARVRHQELSVVMADIDHFKTVNDTFGHRKGDDVLAKIGELILSTVRHGDYVGRYGGEEFIILLPKTSAIDAFIVCEKIREKVKAAKLLGEDHPLTISLGLSTFPDTAQTEEELIERADQALYASKNMGRDRTTQYDSKVSSSMKRYDKLAGILSGNVSNDARVIKAMIDLMNLVGEKMSIKQKYRTALGILLDITEGQEATLVIGDQKHFEIFERHRGDDRIKQRSRMSKGLVEGFLHVQTDDFFIHWNDIDEVDRVSGMPNWKSYIVTPLIVNGESIGLIIVRIPIKEKEFEFKHYNFVKQLSSVIASLKE